MQFDLLPDIMCIIRSCRNMEEEMNVPFTYNHVHEEGDQWRSWATAKRSECSAPCLPRAYRLASMVHGSDVRIDAAEEDAMAARMRVISSSVAGAAPRLAQNRKRRAWP